MFYVKKKAVLPSVSCRPTEHLYGKRVKTEGSMAFLLRLEALRNRNDSIAAWLGEVKNYFLNHFAYHPPHETVFSASRR